MAIMRSCLVFLWLLLFGCYAAPLGAQEISSTSPQSQPKNILLLYSYGHGGKGVGVFDEGFLSAMDAAGVKVNNLFFEYLDLERTKDDPQYRPLLRSLLHKKYANRKIDLIITVQQPALQFLLQEGREIAAAAPAITLQAAVPTVDEAHGRTIVSQLARFDIQGTLERALELFPDTRHVMVVSGNSEADRKMAAEAARVATRWQDKLQFEYPHELAMDALLQRVAHLPPHSIVLFTQYNRDIAGRITTAYEVEGMLAKAANAPVFGLYDFNLRNGGIGGSVISVRMLGANTARTALDILDGKLALREPVTSIDNPVAPMFDWSQIERWGGDASRLPGHSVFVNRMPSFWQQYQFYVIAAVVFVLAQSLMIAGLLVNMRHRRRAEQALRESEQRLALATRFSGVGIWDWDLATDTLVWEDSMFDLYQIRRQDFAGAYAAWHACVHPQDMERTTGEVEAALAGNKPFDTEFRVTLPSGAIRHIHAVAQVLRDGQDKPRRMIGANWDITPQKEAEEELQIAASFFHASSEGMLVADADNRIIAINPAFTQMTGYRIEELAGQTPRMFKSGRHDDEFYREMWHALQTCGKWRGEIWDRNKNGMVVAKRLAINTIYHEDGSVHRRIALSSDITDKKRVEETIWRQANYDALTGLPNRSLFRDRLAQEIKKAQRGNHTLALLFIDLDHFKEVNDTLGHDLGDKLLAEAAQRISACVRESDTVARLGGDEFTIVLPDLSETARVDQVAQALLHALAQPCVLRGESVYVSASIGITLYPHDVTDIDALLKNADQAMYVAKQKGRNGFSYFIASMQESAQERQHLIRDLRGALAAGQLEVHFQPIVELASGRIHKAEALLRWRHPARGMVSPAQFIPLAEDTGLIHDIGDWVFREAAQLAKRIIDADGNIEPVQISVNKSPRQFVHGHTQRAWIRHLDEIGLPAEYLAIEITEGLLLEARAEVMDKLVLLRDSGMQISLDDFGTGYSAMGYLRTFSIDFLKIDQSFVRDMTTEPGDWAIVEAIIVMAHRLGLKVIAEGVETAAQRDWLITAGCDYAQGYLFARPMPAAAFEALLQDAMPLDARP